jgi:hypothetical protein
LELYTKDYFKIVQLQSIYSYFGPSPMTLPHSLSIVQADGVSRW